jgi:hypothetical protein
LLTYSPGDEIYSCFGHSALRVRSGNPNHDWVYNYGTFDFNDPRFYIGFISGKLYYSLSRVAYKHVENEIILENRRLVETPLQLSVEDKERLVRFLEINNLPENRRYLYDFLFNNCSSKIIELIDFATQNRTAYNPMVSPDASFRELLDPYLEGRPWLDMGVDLLMGLPSDRKIEGTEAAFLPDYLHLLVKNARVATFNSTARALAGHDQVRVHQMTSDSRRIIKPAWIFWPLVLILIISTLLGSYISGVFAYLIKTITLIAGILGLVLVLLWFLTDHYIFNFNTDLLWANPLLLFRFILRNKKSKMKKGRWKLSFLFSLAVMISLGILTSFFIEKNTSLTALACIILLGIIEGIIRNRKPDNFPFNPVAG